MRRFLLTVFLLAALSALAAGGWALWWVYQPMRLAAASLDLSIEPGTLPRGVAQAVVDAGVDTSAELLYWWFRLSGQDRPIGRRVQRYFEVNAKTAVEVVSVEPNGPSQRAGLREGDLIVALNGESVATVDEIHRRLTGQPAGSQVQLTILRSMTRMELQVQTGEA